MADHDRSGGPYPADYGSGRTHGSPQRPAHQFARAPLTFDLAAEAAGLRAEEAWGRGARNAKTLVKEPDLRVVLIVLRQGGRMEEHRAPGPISIQTLAGRLRVRAAGRDVDLPTGRVLALEAEVPHDVDGLEESAFLLTIAWPARRHAGAAESEPGGS